MSAADTNLDFGKTSWQSLVAIRDADPARALQALNELCQSYWGPLYAFARRRGFQPQDAQDLVQGLLQRLCEREAFRDYSPSPGVRFRSWLITCLKRFEVDEWRKEGAIRRGGNFHHVSLDQEDPAGRAAYEVPGSPNPELAYEASLARVICQNAFRRLREEQSTAGLETLYDALAPTLLEMRSSGSMETYRRLAAQFGMTTEAIAKRKERMKTRFGEVLREEVRRLVPSDDEVEDELRHLLRSLG